MAVDSPSLRAHHGQRALTGTRGDPCRAVQNVESSASAPTHPHISTLGVLMCSWTARAASFPTLIKHASDTGVSVTGPTAR